MHEFCVVVNVDLLASLGFMETLNLDSLGLTWKRLRGLMSSGQIFHRQLHLMQKGLMIMGLICTKMVGRFEGGKSSEAAVNVNTFVKY